MPLRDLVYAARILSRSPAFSATVLITISLGIGAAAATFSVANAVLLQPLPYKDPDRLFFAVSDLRTRNVKDFPLSNPDFIDLRTGTSEVFEELGAVTTGRRAVPREDGSLEEIRWGSVTPNFFRMLGVKMSLGSDFVEADGQAPPPAAAAPGLWPAAPALAAIISYEYWQRRFGGDPHILGRSMPGAQPGTAPIVGVLAPGFRLFFPLDANMELVPEQWFAARLDYDNAARNNVALRVIGRLREGVTVQRATSAVESIAADIRSKFVINQTAGFHLRVEPIHRHVVERVKPTLLALLGAAVFLLLVACANVANLLLVRASLRERELAVRTALGASRWRLVRQTLSESLLLALVGGMGGDALAWLGIRQLRALAPETLPRLESIAIDLAALAFATLAALAAAVLFGLVPALRAARPDVSQVLRASGRSPGPAGKQSMRNLVVVAEVALAFVLLIGSGLMFRSFLVLQNIDPGYDPKGLLTFQVLGPDGGQPQQRAAFTREIHDRLRSLPGVHSVTASSPFPLTGGFGPIRWGHEAALTDPSRFRAVNFQIVLPGYFETLRTPLLAGRTFNAGDNAQQRNGVVIDQALAAKAFPNTSAVGKRLLIRLRTPEPEWVEVLGVVAHQRDVSLAEYGREQIYFTDGFVGHGEVARWAIRTDGDPAQYAGPVRAAMAEFGSRVSLTEVLPMTTLVKQDQAQTRFSLLLIGVFASVAALLAGIGLYGVLATFVRHRTAEIGVRMAIGAAPGNIVKLVVGQGLGLSIVGIAIGLVAALWLTRFMTTMLVGVTPADPVTFAGIAVLFLAIAALASWLPARRAASLDPAVALREQ